ncbi:PAS domain S-box protein [Schlegelella sp. S2-27]|uniref:histidine kinase n=1 Tax=Caldimonas mangrovi TaxID=2944811 RepID=A0ABT0YPB2_9BURK|nr:PAS domain S-box protein [Caldimonas mangrovi]
MAVIATAAAAGIAAGVDAWAGRDAMLLPAVLAVLAAAACGGLRPGLLATALCTLLFVYLFVPPRYQLAAESADDALAVALFVLIALSTSAVCGALHATRRRLEAQRQQLEMSEVFHRSIADLTTDFAFNARVLKNGRIVTESVTQGFMKVLGYTLDEAMEGGGWRAVVAPEEKPLARECMQRVLAGEEVESEMRHVTKDGRSVWLHFKVRPICDASGRVVRLHGAGRETTERREWERRIRQLNSELEHRVAELQVLFDAAPVAIWLAHDPAGECITGNRYADELMGVASGTNIAGAGTDGQPLARRFRRAGEPVDLREFPLQQAARLGVPVLGYEMEIAVPGRPSAWVMGNAVPLFDRDREVRGALGVFVDMTQRKWVEAAVWQGREQLRLVADHVPVLIAHCDLQRRYKFVNRAYAQRFGLHPKDVVGRHIREVVGEPAYASLQRHVDHVLTGVPVEFEIELPHETLGVQHMHCAYAPELEASGQVIGLVGVMLNISDRRHAEVALEAAHAEAEHRAREAEQAKALLQTIFDNLPEGIVWVGGAPHYPVLANSRFGRELIGVPAGTEGERSVHGEYVVLAPDGSRPLSTEELPLYRASRHGERVNNEELLVQRADGSRVSVLVDAAPIRDAGGAILGAVNCWRDITERKRAEAAQHRSAERFRSLVMATTAIVYTTDPGGSFAAPQSSWQAYTGQPWEAHCGWGWLDAIHPDDRSRVQQAWQQALASGQPYEVEARLWHAPCEAHRYVHGRAVPVHDHAGDVREWMATCSDIHDRRQALEALRQSEERFRLMVESAKDYAIFTLDAEGRVTAWNSGGRHLLGYEDAEILGQHAGILYTPEDRADSAFEREIDKARGEGQAEDERWHVRRDGSRFYASGLLMPLRAGGEERGFLKIMRDVTEAMRSRAMLERQAAALQEADQRKDEFLATLAHELRNPLAPLRNCLEIMRLAGDDAQAAARARSVMERQLRQMVRLIDDLLDVSRISRGKIKLRVARVELAAALRDAVETSRPLIEEAGHHLEVVLPDQALFVDADQTRLAQVVSNLLNNAAKYTETGGRIALQVRRDDNEAVVTVRDDGMGIAEPLLPRLFEMFSQGDRSIERAKGGLGIGLALVKRLVDMHGGSVEAHSAGPGLGSEFTVRLPLAPLPSAGLAPVRHGPAGTAGRRRVLVVDDNKDAALSLAMMLQMLGNETRTAHDGVEALSVAAGFRPEVILLDIGMPRLNGYDTARQMRQEPWGRHVLLVALTGWGQEEDRRRSREAGFDHHLVKPVDPAALERLLHEDPLDVEVGDEPAAEASTSERHIQ